MAQLDAGKMQELFSLACFMAWLKPKMEIQLGKDSLALERIDEMWDLGLLGLFWPKWLGSWLLGEKHIILDYDIQTPYNHVEF